jgi:hypothetical protein
MSRSLAVFGIISALVPLTSGKTCYKSDRAVLGDGSTFTNNLLTCAEKMAKQGQGSATPCLEDRYPAYAAVSESCLLCTTEVVSSESGLSCLANCIYDQTSSTCSTCSPKLASAWTDACDKGLTAPTENSTADIPTCRKEDISLIPSAQSFVGGGLNCLKDLSTFSTCLATNVPYYGQVSVDCKLCAESQTTSGGITADGCGAICMQEPSTSTECEKCASNLSDSFNQYCLGNVNSSVTPTMAVSATIVGVYFLLYM